MKTLIELMNDRVKEKSIDFNDYNALFQTEDGIYLFLMLSSNPEIKDDEVLLSMGSATKEDLIAYMNDMDKGDVKAYLEEHEVKTIEEYIEKYTLHAVDDIAGYFGMIEFEVGHGEVWHKTKVEDINNSIEKYLNLYKI